MNFGARKVVKVMYRLIARDQKIKLVGQENARAGMQALKGLAIWDSCIKIL